MKKLDTKDDTVNKTDTYVNIKLKHTAALLVDTLKHYGSFDNLSSHEKKECLELWDTYFQNQEKNTGTFLDVYFSAYFNLMDDIGIEQKRRITNTRDFEQIMTNFDLQRANLQSGLVYLEKNFSIKLSSLKGVRDSLWNPLNLGQQDFDTNTLRNFLNFLSDNFSQHTKREKTEYLLSLAVLPKTFPKGDSKDKRTNSLFHFFEYYSKKENFNDIAKLFDLTPKEASYLFEQAYKNNIDLFEAPNFKKNSWDSHHILKKDIFAHPTLSLVDKKNIYLSFWSKLDIEQTPYDFLKLSHAERLKKLQLAHAEITSTTALGPLSAGAQKGVENLALYFLQLNQVNLQGWKGADTVALINELPQIINNNSIIEQELSKMLLSAQSDKKIEDFYTLVATPALARFVINGLNLSQKQSAIMPELIPTQNYSSLIAAFPLPKNSMKSVATKITFEKALLDLSLTLQPMKSKNPILNPQIKTVHKI